MTQVPVPLEPLRLDGQVAIVTGGSRGLGREYALALAGRGARVAVHARSVAAAQVTVDEIAAGGGEAIACAAEITDGMAVLAMVQAVLQRWQRIDILVNNAGFVRDRSFAKQPEADFRAVVETHLMGSYHCTQAVWPGMLEARYGRIVMAVSSTGLAGNFGQAAYGAAKMALVGLARTLGIEGARHNVRVNCFSPIGITRMNAAVIPEALHAALAPDHLRAGLLWLAGPQAPNRMVLLGAGGVYGAARTGFTRGCRLQQGTPEELAARHAEVEDLQGMLLPEDAMAQLDLVLAHRPELSHGAQ